MTTRKQYDSHFKPRVALEAIRNRRTIAEIASEYGVHANQISKWKKRVLDELPGIFSNKREKTQQNNMALQDELYRQIGQLKVELDWMKKSWYPRLMRNAIWWSQDTRKYPYIDSANCWVYHAPASNINQRVNLNTICF